MKPLVSACLSSVPPPGCTIVTTRQIWGHAVVEEVPHFGHSNMLAAILVRTRLI
jgi:hypothetical protein